MYIALVSSKSHIFLCPTENHKISQLYHELFVVVLEAAPGVLLVVVALDGDHRLPVPGGGEVARGGGADVAVHAVPHHVAQVGVRVVLDCREKAGLARFNPKMQLG